MQFKGQLLLPDEPGPGLRVNLDVAEHHLAVESDGGGLGAWPLETVAVERLQGDIFALTVAGESLRFVADDTIAFTYSGLPTIERVSRRPKAKTRSPFRSMLDWVWNGPEKPAQDPTTESTTPESAGPPSTDLVTMPVAEEVTGPNPYPEADSTEEIEVVDHLEEGSSRAASEVFSSIGIPFVEVDQFEDADPQQEVETDELEEMAHDPNAPGPDVVSESPIRWEEIVDPEGCPAIRSDGRRCESPILTSSGYCYPHDPKRALADKYQSAQEARARLKRDATGRLNRVYARLDKALRQVEHGDLDAETAMAMAQLARTMCAILEIDETSTGE